MLNILIQKIQQTKIYESRGFTLLELLVTILIVSILFGFFSLAIRKARAQAESIVCMNNLKQMGLAFSIYANENHDMLPYPNDFYGSEISWFRALDQVLCSQMPEDSSRAQKLLFAKHDPVIKRLDSFWLTNSHTIKMNQWLGVDETDQRRFYRMQEFENPISTVLLFDGRAETEKLSNGRPAPTAKNPQGSEGLVSRRHSARANVLFLDGHVELREEKQQTTGQRLGWEVNKTRLIWKPWNKPQEN